jgi:hypothetical protein
MKVYETYSGCISDFDKFMLDKKQKWSASAAKPPSLLV